MKFYQRGWFIWLMLILFAPVGIILLWTQKKYKVFPRVILSIVFLVFFIGVVSSGGADEPSSGDIAGNIPTATPATQGEKAAEPTKEPEPEPTPEFEIEIAAKELAEAFDENEVRANQDYKGKIARIEGEISDIGEVLGQTYIVLSNEDDSFSNFVDVQCYFRDKDQISKIAEKNKGDRVVVIGKIEGKSINVSVENCRFAD